MIDPKLKEYATPTQLKYIEAVEKFGSHRAAAEALGVVRGAVGNAIARVKAVAARSGYSPEHDMNHLVPDGYMVRGVSSYFNAEGKLAGQWVKSSIDHERQVQIIREIVEALSESIPKAEPVQPPQGEVIDALCNLIVFTDYHLGQLSYGKETGDDWDIKIAEQVLVSSFMHMIEYSPKAKTLVFCIQGDFLHSDGLLPLTPAHKNVLDTDSRFSKIVSTAIRVIRNLIRFALQKHEAVHLVICEGNHDEASSVWLRHLFTALYEDEKRLTVNQSELPFYAYQHGEVMLGFHHGHKVKNEQLPLLFAAQYAKMWGATTKRYVNCGHRHHVDEKEFNGMIVIQHPTLAARDAHSARGGYISNRSASVITYHEKYGQVARTTVCPEMFE